MCKPRILCFTLPYQKQNDMTKFDLQQARKFIPYKGMGEISLRARVLQSEVTRAFKGYEAPSTEKVRKATREYLTEVSTGLTQLLQQS